MNNINFSVIIPVYNGEKFIKASINSVLEQTYIPYEIIVVDDGSTDSTSSIVKSYQENVKNVLIKYRYQSNQGPAKARAEGIELAEGNYIALLDADDIWYRNKLEIYCQAIRSHQADIFYSDENEIDTLGHKYRRTHFQLGNDPLFELITGDNPISTSTVVVCADFMKKNHSFGDGIKNAEDIACWIALSRAKGVFCYVPEVTGEYRRHEDSLTLSDEVFMKRTYDRLIDFYKILQDEGYSEVIIEEHKKRQVAKGYYSMARFYHREKKYHKAMQFYLEAMKSGNRDIKTLAGLIMAVVHVKK